MNTLLKLSGAMFVTLVCVAALASTPARSPSPYPPVSATSQPAASENSKQSAVKKKTPKKSARPVFVKDSAETASERSVRLKRECKGAVNAGACAGYTR